MARQRKAASNSGGGGGGGGSTGGSTGSNISGSGPGGGGGGAGGGGGSGGIGGGSGNSKHHKNKSPKQLNRNENSSSSTGTNNTPPIKSSPKLSNLSSKQGGQQTTGQRHIKMNKWIILCGCSCLIIASYFGYLGYLETRVNTPFDDQKIVQRTGLDDLDRYWGSYRSGVYFGLKTRDPQSLVMGLMWYSPLRLKPGGEGIRHWCENGDNLDKYGWLQHDGKTFGYQEIIDYPFRLETSFMKFPDSGKYGGDWTSRISIRNMEKQSTDEPISLIWYAALDEKTQGFIETNLNANIPSLYGQTSGLGEFHLNLYNSNNGTIIHQSYLSTNVANLKDLRQAITSQLQLVIDPKTKQRQIALPGDVFHASAAASATGMDGDINSNRKSGDGSAGGPDRIHQPNFIAILLTVKPPFTLDIAYNSINGKISIVDISKPPPIKEDYTRILTEKRLEFSRNFENIFKLSSGKGYTDVHVKFAEAALSNMLGGIGYFYGASKVQSVHTKEPVPYWKAALYTAVPSRSFFPRGFLWDEGFHGLLISAWDIDIELDIISHWFDLMNVEGWIPREQILGVEALAKVPDEFVIQRNTNANPPTFFLTLKLLLNKYSHLLLDARRFSILERLYPRLQTWFNWYNSTQKGDLPGTYRWRGRDINNLRELNIKTLTSGLDDYPRASHPNDMERHVDLRCWIGFAAGVMANLAHFLGRDDSKYWETHYYLSDNSLLNELHLSPYTQTYSDWGLHTDSVVLKHPPPIPLPQQFQHLSPHQQQQIIMQQQQQREKIRVSLKPPELRFIDSTYGYVSLFPFLLEILTVDSPYLGRILKDIHDVDKLWTNYGLRSLSKLSPLYMKRNTEHDPPYWRGQIWININYLALKALYHYASQPGPYSDEAKKIYVELRHNIVTNLLTQYQRTGYIWEQYNDRTGEGSGCKPFTGWSGLVVLIMSEQYQ